MEKNIEYFMALPYATVTTDDEYTNGEFCVIAEHPQLTGCMAQGSNKDEALANLVEARRDYITAMLRRNLEVPEPVVSTVSTVESTWTSVDSLSLVPDIDYDANLEREVTSHKAASF